MLNINEINEQLKDLSSELCVAFATRAALRILPLLASYEKSDQPFWYWKKAQKEHMLAIFTASHFSLAFSFGVKNKSVFDTFLDAISVADNVSDAASDAFSAETETAVEAIFSARAATVAVAAYTAATIAADVVANADLADDSYDYLDNISKLFLKMKLKLIWI